MLAWAQAKRVYHNGLLNFDDLPGPGRKICWNVTWAEITLYCMRTAFFFFFLSSTVCVFKFCEKYKWRQNNRRAPWITQARRPSLKLKRTFFWQSSKGTTVSLLHTLHARNQGWPWVFAWQRATHFPKTSKKNKHR